MKEDRLLTIDSGKGFDRVSFKEIWRYRELLFFLAWRDIKVKYKQTILGIAWAIIQPILMMVVFSVLFGQIARIPSDGIPYPIFVLMGLLFWNTFASVTSLSTTSLVSNTNLISKIYFPRIIIPFSSAIVVLVDFIVGFIVLIIIMLWYGIIPGIGIAIVPCLVFLTLIAAIGCGIWFSALNVRYRDIQQLVPFMLQILMFLTPIIYPRSLIGDKWGWLVFLNPVGGVVEAFRHASFAYGQFPTAGLAISAGVALTIFLTGLIYFWKVDRSFADII